MSFHIYPPVTVQTSPSSLALQRGPAGAFTLTDVSKDTTTPANTVPVPVELVSSAGQELQFTANREAQTNDADAIAELALIKAAVQAQLKPVDFIDTPTGPLLNAATNPIPSGTFLTLVASTAAPVKKIQVVDEIGEFMALYTGAAASEVLLCGLGLGGSLIDVDLPAGTRISIASLSGSPVNAGRMFINFLG